MGKFNRAVARMFGYDLSRYKNSFRFDATFDRLVANHKFDCVIDVGANVGTFSKRCLKALPSVPVHSFEPTRALADKLSVEAGPYDKWQVHRVALSDQEGKATLNTSSEKSVFNSLNAANPDFLKKFSGLSFDASQEVDVSTLDIFMKANSIDAQDILLKVDTQGHDYKVLLGARDTLLSVAAVIVELPFQNIYNSTDTHKEIMDLLESSGFYLYSISPISCDERGAIIEADGFFARK